MIDTHYCESLQSSLEGMRMKRVEHNGNKTKGGKVLWKDIQSA
jgi:hypothetical protein